MSQQESATGEIIYSQKNSFSSLSKENVLEEEKTQSWNLQETEDLSASGSQTQSGETILSVENLGEVQNISGLCENPIQSWISLSGKNDSEDVLKLEKFLNEYESENLKENGVFESSDELAVKRFQEKYRSSILTPAGIRNPTGVVYTGTIKIITGIACGKEYPVSSTAQNIKKQESLEKSHEESLTQTGTQIQETASGTLQSDK